MIDDAVKNPWGVAFGPATPLWVTNQFSNTITRYRGANGVAPISKLGLVVTAASPTGMVFNPTSSFTVTQGGVTAPANFLFNEFLTPAQGPPSAAITGWSNASAPPPPTVTVTVTRATTVGAFYTGLALVPAKGTESGPVLLAADSANGTVDVFDGDFTPVLSKKPAFVDPTPHAFPIAPYNVAYLDDRVYVAYAPAFGEPGDSAISVFKRDGSFIKRLVTGAPLAGPWGMAIAPEHWGEFGGALLVGNVFDGTINAFNPRNGHLLGTIENDYGTPLVNPGLWGIQFGNGVIGTPQTLIFAAGIGSGPYGGGNDVYEHGLIGLIEPVNSDGD